MALAVEQSNSRTVWYGEGFDSVPQYYGKYEFSTWAYMEELREELLKYDEVEQGFIFRARLEDMSRCGQVVKVRTCECCGEDRAGSGTFREVNRTCGGRSCPYCSWVRATNRVDLVEYAAQTLPVIQGYRWQFITFNPKYDKDKRSYDMSVQGLRERALLTRRIASECWKRILKGQDAAFLRHTEISYEGLVHLHCIYYGVEIDDEKIRELEKLASKIYRRPVRCNVKKIGCDSKGKVDPEQLAKAARYAAKSIKGSAAAFDEDFLTGEKSGWLLHPELGARWEMATYKINLSQCFGGFVGLNVPKWNQKEEKDAPPDDDDTECPNCGVIGFYKDSYRRAHDFLIKCHLEGKAGMEGNNWLPYWMRINVRNKKLREREKRRRLMN